VRARVAALRDLIAMKRASGRPKDLSEVEVLSACRKKSTGYSRHCRARETTKTN
jgi:hypothetical protein